jgi:hypothetical protein
MHMMGQLCTYEMNRNFTFILLHTTALFQRRRATARTVLDATQYDK